MVLTIFCLLTPIPDEDLGDAVTACELDHLGAVGVLGVHLEAA